MRLHGSNANDWQVRRRINYEVPYVVLYVLYDVFLLLLTSIVAIFNF